MKKLIVFVLILACLSSTMVAKSWNNPIYNLPSVERACVISEKQYEDLENVKCGDVYFNYCTYLQAKEILDDDIKGFQVYFNNKTFDSLKNLLQMKVVKTEQVEDLTVYLGYTPYWRECLLLDGKKVNVQIAVRDGYIVAGFPAILTGY